MASAAEEEQALRRVRSTGDIPNPDPPFRPPHARNSTSTSYRPLPSIQLSSDPAFLSPIPPSPSPSPSPSIPPSPSTSSALSLPSSSRFSYIDRPSMMIPAPLHRPEPMRPHPRMHARAQSPSRSWDIPSLGILHEEAPLHLHSPHSPIPHPSRSPRLPSSPRLSHSHSPLPHHPPVPLPQLPPTNPMPSPIIERTDFVGRVLTFFGYAGPNAKARKELVGLIWNLTFGFAQFVVIITLLIYSGIHASPRNHNISEWDACEKPLGAWNSIWLVRVVLGCIVSYWGFKRERAQRLAQERRESGRDIELGRPSHTNPMALPPPPGGSPGRVGSLGAARPTNGGAAAEGQGAAQTPLPHSYLFSRLSLFTSVLSLVWFLTAHILEYTSVNTCRFSAPHLWWLTFGILCILYLMVLEIFLLGLLVFILGPVIYLGYSLILLCMGRHPIQNPPIKPEIGKLSQSVVDQIPLVLYVPAHKDDEGDDEKVGKEGDEKDVTEAYSYPPKTPSKLRNKEKGREKKKKRFTFLRKALSRSSGSKSGKSGNGEGDGEGSWEDDWEKGKYPFVRMEGHRATCAICLMDFDEPPRVRKGRGKQNAQGNHESLMKSKLKSRTEGAEDEQEQEQESGVVGDAVASTSGVEEVQVEEVSEEERERIQLEGVGEGPQPLRLLPCGHAFHKTCIDPWLTGMSGRCPTCQRPIEIPDKNVKKKRRGGGNQGDEAQGNENRTED